MPYLVSIPLQSELGVFYLALALLWFVLACFFFRLDSFPSAKGNHMNAGGKRENAVGGKTMVYRTESKTERTGLGYRSREGEISICVKK